MGSRKIIQVEDKVPFNLLVPLSIQHMFAMFGASVLVPFLFGINPAVVLFMNGVGTLLFMVLTKGKAPAYLGSSFAFIAPAQLVIQQMGYEYALGGFVAVGFLGCVLAFIIYKFGSDWIDVVPAAGGHGTGGGSDRPGTVRQCGGYGGDPWGSGGYEKCDRICGDSGCGCVWKYSVQRISLGNPYPDRCDRRICGGAGLRDRGFPGSGGGLHFRGAEFLPA